MFTPLEEIPFNEELLCECGIYPLGLEFCPTIDYEETGEPYISGTKAMDFIFRYNRKEIVLQRRVDSYIKNKDIQDCLSDLEIDPERFWYLLLFIYDYSIGSSGSRVKIEEGAGEQIEKFTDLIYRNCYSSYSESEQTIEIPQEISFNSPAELTLRIGKEKLTITDSKAIGMIGIMCTSLYSEIKDERIFMGHGIIAKKDKKKASAMAYLFCKMFRYYFDNTSHIKERRAKGANISNKEKELLSYLLYFTKISENKKLLEPLEDEYNTVKGLMNPKKTPKSEISNSYY